ncbi:regucalcin-like [Schistocerca cancellata]|uniref:regucalcin-like n=1 Tax=Schistocerca cancellata TaxID=274614 RepID=UPI002118B670|nr:regucalcin-like [Schistocerca cancellata]XP_049771806.1 regucalcin-like [Schistocerca cancellata]
MSPVTVEKITEPCQLGEGPHWDADKKVLYFVDIGGNRVHKYDPATRTLKSLTLEGVHFIIPVKGKADKFVISMGRNVVLMTWDGESSEPAALEVIATVDDEDGSRDNKINDAKADAAGTLWSGTLGPIVNNEITPEKGILFNLAKDRSTKTHVTKISISNGFAWSPDNKTMYYIDSATGKIDAFDFDITESKIGNRRTVFNFKENGVEGLPDGQTIDTDGNLWVACFGGKQVIQVDPRTGRLLRRVEIPALNVTSVAWGGAGLDELFVTTGSIGMDRPDELPMAGCTFRVTGLGARGLPAQSVVL